ncbi:MAG: glycosyltransferase [bacterium]
MKSQSDIAATTLGPNDVVCLETSGSEDISAPTEKHVLFVAYEFPPTGGAGIQRTAKFVKYLPQFGWFPSVLTVSNPSVPVFDESLLQDVPEITRVVRAPTWEPGYGAKKLVGAGSENGNANKFVGYLKRTLRDVANLILQPDPQILWAPRSVQAGRRLLRELPHQAIYATGPPFSSFVIGYRLSRAFGLPLILDYRDEWSISNRHRENRTRGAVSGWYQQRLEKRILRHASAVLATTRASAHHLGSIARTAGSRARVTHVYNGFDPTDFTRVNLGEARAAVDLFRVCYVGTLWNLTSVKPLVEAVRLLCTQAPSIADRLELVFAGRRTEEQERLLDCLDGSPVRVVRRPYVEHEEAIRLLRSSSLLCLLLSDTAEASRVVPGKVFEYMAARRPILAIAPEGEVWDLLKDCPSATCVRPTDVSAIAACLKTGLERLGGRSQSTEATFDISRFARPAQAGELASVLDGVTSRSITSDLVSRAESGLLPMYPAAVGDESK